MYRILEVCVDLDGGGIDRYLYNYCTKIDNIQFDFAAVESKCGILEKPLIDHGSNVYKVPRLNRGIIDNFLGLKKIMCMHHYDAVHIHLGYYSLIALLAAIFSGIKVRIVHAHIANPPLSKKERFFRIIFTPLVKLFATHLAACGFDAANWVWGECFRKGKVKIHNNAINTEQFRFSPKLREQERNLLNIPDDTLVVGHVGRFSDQKNQIRLIQIFSKIHKRHDKSILCLIGFHDNSYPVKEEISNYGLTDNVFILGVREDVHLLLNAMDIFVFPSKYEGLPFTLIETQCNGLYSLSADTVSKYTKVTDCLEFMSLNSSDEEWASKAIEMSRLGHDEKAIESVISAGYDLSIEKDKLKEYYINAIETQKK